MSFFCIKATVESNATLLYHGNALGFKLSLETAAIGLKWGY